MNRPSNDDGFYDDMPLSEAQKLVKERIEEGLICPCCKQRAQIYERPINGTMARSLIAFYREYGREWGSLPELRRKVALHHSNQEAQMAHFGLFEEQRSVRREDGGRAGWWRVTDLGERWLKGEVAIPSRARQYGRRPLGLVGEPVTISEVLDKPFDLREVLNQGVA